MNSSSQDRKLTDPERWAAVATYWCDGISGHRWIVYPEQPEQYVRQIAKDLSEWAILLVEHYAEAVNLAELDLLHEAFGTGPYSEDAWDWMAVCDLLKRLPDIAIAEYRESNSPAVGSSFWYSQLIEFLNDTFPDDDGVWLNFEGPLSEFLPTLLGFRGQGVQGGWRFVRFSRFLAGPSGRFVSTIVAPFRSEREMASPQSTRDRI